MKKLILTSLSLTLLGFSVNAGTITVYGRNEGTTSTTTTTPDGTTTVTTINSDNFFHDICYTVSDVPIQVRKSGIGGVGNYVHIISVGPLGATSSEGFLQSRSVQSVGAEKTVHTFVLTSDSK